MSYPSEIAALSNKSDGPSQTIFATHMNEGYEASRSIRSVLGDTPQGSEVDIQTRLAVMLATSGNLNGFGQMLWVAKLGSEYSTIQSAIDAITDATINKQYTVVVMPGIYTETVTCKDYVHLFGIERQSCKVVAPTDGRACTTAIANISNMTFYSDESSICFRVTTDTTARFTNLHLYCSGNTTAYMFDGNPQFYDCFFEALEQLCLSVGDGYPEFYRCHFHSNQGNGEQVSAGESTFNYCVFFASDGQFTTLSGAYSNFFFCFLYEELGGAGTKNKGTMSGSCANYS